LYFLKLKKTNNMPLPLILGTIAAIAGITGVGAGVKGGIDMINAKDTLNKAKRRDEKNQQHQEFVFELALKSMDKLGKLEMEILSSFKDFSDIVEKIKNRPSFAEIKIGKVSIPRLDLNEIKETSVGASILIGGLVGSALGTAGGFAASGATTAAVMALGTASTGTAISTLSGAAATNATLAALGGGSLAAGGGGIALGSAILGATTLGVGLLVGGIIFSLTGADVSKKANEAYNKMLENEKIIRKICLFLLELTRTSRIYYNDLNKANRIYIKQFAIMRNIVDTNKGNDGFVDWMKLSPSEKTTINNVVMLVGLLYHMCKVKLVNRSENDYQINTINTIDIQEAKDKYQETMKVVGGLFT
jgi:hypothetical protein